MKIGFIFPSSDYLFDPFRGDPFTHFHLLTYLEATFGSEIQATLIDLRGIKKEFAIYHIPECDVYLHSVYTLDFSEQLGILSTIRERFPKALHIAGGPHANVFQTECAQIFDAIILGEGEESLVQAVRDVKAHRLEKVYKQCGPVDINKYPFWRRHFLPKTTVARKNMMNLRRTAGYEDLLATTVMFSRGCPYKCSFCAMQHHRDDTPGIRFRSPQLIEDEIKYLKDEYSIRGLAIMDEICIPLKKQAAVDHLDAIKRSDVVWRGQCRVDGITDEIAARARDSGCVAMGMGCESVSQRALDLINKRIKVEKAREAIKLLKKNGIEVRLYLILGLPGEPADIVDQSWNFILETDPEVVFLSLFTVRPGTEVYRNPEKFGIKSISSDWEKTMHLYGRYDNEMPTLTFEYQEDNPWGKSIPSEKIIENYLELQNRLHQRGIANLAAKPEVPKPKDGLLTATALGA